MRKGNSTQEFIGIKGFTKNGLKVGRTEFILYQVQPTNISVLSPESIEISCTDSCECFDDNRYYLKDRIEMESNSKVRGLLEKDLDFLDNIQTETATARQFLFIARCKSAKPEQVMSTANRVEKVISDQGFEVKRMSKRDIKRFLAIYFDASMDGDKIPDYDGEQFFEV